MKKRTSPAAGSKRVAAPADELGAEIIAHAGEGIVAYDRELRYTVWNPTMERLTGLAAKEVLGRPALELFPHLAASGIDVLLRRALNGERVSSPDVSFRIASTGNTGWIAGTYVPHRNGAGDVIGVVGVVTDVTVRRRTQEELRRSEERYRSLFEQSRDAIMLTDENLRITDANPAAILLFGASDRGGLIGLDATDSIFSDEVASLKMKEDLRSTGAVHGVEVAARGTDGRSLVLNVAASALLGEEGDVRSYRVLVQDVTERRSLERRMAQIQKMESVATLAEGIAHDFNNLLAIIVGLTHRLETEENPTAIREGLEAITTTVHRGAELVRQVLTFAQQTEAQFGPVEIKALLLELHRLLRETFPRTIEITVETDPEMPWFLADRGHLHQALLNLCVNARDAMPAGGMLNLKASVTEASALWRRFPDAAAGEYIALKVSDTGEGMDDATKRRAFEPFFTTKGAGKGTGLGLSVVYGIVKGHGGFVDLVSEPGKGTSFILYLPLRRVSPPDTAGRRPEALPRGTETILIIEDEDILLDLLAVMLRSSGYTALTAHDGQEGLDIFQHHEGKIDLVLSDMGLPKMGGWEAMTRILQLDPSARVVLASGFVDPRIHKEMLKSGARDFVQKPYDPAQLMWRIRDIIDGKG